MRPFFALLPALCSVLVGCSANVGTTEVEAASASAVTGVVVVERSEPIGSEAASRASGRVLARFVRARPGPVDDDALRLVGAGGDAPEIGSCEPLHMPLVPHAAVARQLELLDVGNVSVTYGATSMRAALAARTMPDVTDLVSGVVYARTETETPPAAGAFVLHVDGRGLQPAFQVSATAPAPLAALFLAGNPLDGRDVPVDQPASLTWDAAGAGPDDDLIVVELSTREGALRCGALDAGKLEIPATQLATLLGSYAELEASVSVHRVHREALRATGIDSGEIRFDFARNGAVRLTSRRP